MPDPSSCAAAPAAPLQIPDDQVLGDTTQPFCVLKQMRYQGHVSSPGSGLFGAGAHCDWGSWTVLATDSVPGLQASEGGCRQWAGSGGRSLDAAAHALLLAAARRVLAACRTW